MKPEYEEYISVLVENNRARHGSQGPSLSRRDLIRHQCSPFVIAFVAKFPELTAVRGWIVFKTDDPSNGHAVEHWWCTASDGGVVDPTREQFAREGEYVPYGTTTKYKMRTGTCPNCSGDVYEDMDFGGLCSDDCQAEYTAWIKRDNKRFRA